MTKWEEWEHVHAKEDVRDLNIVLVIFAMIAVVLAVLNLSVS